MSLMNSTEFKSLISTIKRKQYNDDKLKELQAEMGSGSKKLSAAQMLEVVGICKPRYADDWHKAFGSVVDRKRLGLVTNKQVAVILGKMTNSPNGQIALLSKMIKQMRLVDPTVNKGDILKTVKWNNDKDKVAELLRTAKPAAKGKPKATRGKQPVKKETKVNKFGYCKKCGDPLDKNQKFCEKCGTKAVKDKVQCFCKGCGKKGIAGEFCKGCGKKLKA